MRLKENSQISSFRQIRGAVDAAFLPRLLKMIHDRWRIPLAAVVFRATRLTGFEGSTRLTEKPSVRITKNAFMDNRIHPFF